MEESWGKYLGEYSLKINKGEPADPSEAEGMNAATDAAGGVHRGSGHGWPRRRVAHGCATEPAAMHPACRGPHRSPRVPSDRYGRGPTSDPAAT